jgi:hypothetical protein
VIHVFGSRPPCKAVRPRARHENVGNPTIAEAVLDRFVHNAYRIELLESG